MSSPSSSACSVNSELGDVTRTGCTEVEGLMSRLGDGSRFIDAVWIVEATSRGKEADISFLPSAKMKACDVDGFGSEY